MAVLWFATLQDGLASLDPLDGGCGSQKDFLSFEAAGACVDDYSSCLISTGEARWKLNGCVPLQLALLGFVGSAGWMQHLRGVGHCEQGTSFGVALAQ